MYISGRSYVWRLPNLLVRTIILGNVPVFPSINSQCSAGHGALFSAVLTTSLYAPQQLALAYSLAKTDNTFWRKSKVVFFQVITVRTSLLHWPLRRVRPGIEAKSGLEAT